MYTVGQMMELKMSYRWLTGLDREFDGGSPLNSADKLVALYVGLLEFTRISVSSVNHTTLMTT